MGTLPFCVQRQAKDLMRHINVSLADPDLMFRENLRILTQPIHRSQTGPPAAHLSLLAGAGSALPGTTFTRSLLTIDGHQYFSMCSTASSVPRWWLT